MDEPIIPRQDEVWVHLDENKVFIRQGDRESPDGLIVVDRHFLALLITELAKHVPLAH